MISGIPAGSHFVLSGFILPTGFAPGEISALNNRGTVVLESITGTAMLGVVNVQSSDYVTLSDVQARIKSLNSTLSVHGTIQFSYGDYGGAGISATSSTVVLSQSQSSCPDRWSRRFPDCWLQGDDEVLRVDLGSDQSGVIRNRYR